jgi:hypothetical protein
VTAKQFDETIGHKDYFDNVNSVQRILQTLARPTETRDEGMFAEAPIVTRNDVQAALSKYEGAVSKRDVRASKRVANTAPTPVTGPKKQKSVPMVKKGAVAAVTPGAPKPVPRPIGHDTRRRRDIVANNIDCTSNTCSNEASA